MSEITPPISQETPPKSVEELQAEIAKLESDKNGLVGETQELRKSRQEKEQEIADLKTALAAAAERNQMNPEEEKIAQAVAAAFAEREQKSAKANLEAAFAQFVTEHNEYHPDNDVGGLKLDALKREFANFNTSTLVAKEDFMQVIGKANALLRGTDTPRQTTEQPYSSTPSTPAAPSAPQASKLSETEQQLAKDNGWSEDQFLKLKEKYPEMIDDLIRPVVH